MKHLIAGIFFILFFVCGQAQFILKGKIEYEKVVNVHKQIGENFWSSEVKKSIPEFNTTYFNLSFNNEKSLYEPGKEIQQKKSPFMGDAPASANVVYTDFVNEQAVTNKQVFEETFLIQDSVKKYKWRITNDTRKIAGFECRRATTIIMDSVFVVAFYTDEIVAPGGPESFNGLPGMILGVVIPRLYTNWYATKIELETVKEAAIVAPKKGRKPTTTAGMEKTVLESLKKWGEWGQKYLWQILI